MPQEYQVRLDFHYYLVVVFETYPMYLDQQLASLMLNHIGVSLDKMI
jgi:hypothetical protein